MSNSKFDEWAFDQTVTKGGTIFGCKDKSGVNVGFVNTVTGEYFSLNDEWISVVDESPPLKEILDKPLSVAGDDIPPLNISIKVLRIIRGEVSVGAVEWFDHGWVNATHWQPLPPTK